MFDKKYTSVSFNYDSIEYFIPRERCFSRFFALAGFGWRKNMTSISSFVLTEAQTTQIVPSIFLP